ncbi:MAG: hypothetical protein ACREPH_12970 [Rhodanobacteraceae bacterium]
MKQTDWLAPCAACGVRVCSDARKAVQSVDERFGKQMQNISVLAPPDDTCGTMT